MLANAGERALLASGDHWGWGAAAVTIVGTPLVAVAEPCSWPLQVACFVTPLLQWKSVNHLETNSDVIFQLSMMILSIRYAVD